jgi:hypothetical protein
MKSRYVSAALLAAVFCATPALADVTTKQKTGGQGLGSMASGESTQYIKGLRIRTDQTIAGAQTSTIIDVQAKQMWVINHAKKEVEVYDMTRLSEGLSKVPVSEISATITPTGQTRQIAGSTCTVHDVTITVPMQMGNEKLSFVMSGPYCLVKNGPGQADYAAFYRKVSQDGLFFGDPRQAKGMPAQSKALTEMYRRMSELGVPFSTEAHVKFEGTSPMAAAMSKMGGNTITTEVVSVSTAAIADSVFDVPADYKVNKR